MRCTFFHKGENDNYRIESEQGKFCLRVYRARHSNPRKVEPELTLLNELAEEALPVSHPLHTRQQSLSVNVTAPEGVRTLVLFSWAPGAMLNRDAPTSWDIFGSELARLHHASALTSNLPHYDKESLLTRPAARWSHRMQAIGLNPLEVQKLAEILDERMDPLWDRLPSSLVHGDAAGGNSHVDESGNLTWFDFLWKGYGPSVWDLATFRRGAGQVQANWDLALEGYQSVRPLSVAEQEAIPHLAAIRCIFVTDLIIDECDIDLHAEATPSWFDSRVRELRRLVDGSHWVQ